MTTRDNPLNEIRDLVLDTGPTSGTVVSLGVGTALVATKAGTVRAQDGGLALSPGDKVRLQGDTITGFSGDTAGVPVFIV
jgi:hypothetical protein